MQSNSRGKSHNMPPYNRTSLQTSSHECLLNSKLQVPNLTQLHNTKACFLTLQVVLSHTPYRELAKTLGDKPVVISGRGASEVAKAYGFTKAVTTSQLSARYPTAVPFCHDPGIRLGTIHFTFLSTVLRALLYTHTRHMV